jgi:hypothetical protein
MLFCDVLWTMYVCIVLCHIWSWLPNWFLTLRLSSFFITSMTKKCQTLKLHRSEELRLSEVKIKVLHRLVEEQLTQCLSSEEYRRVMYFPHFPTLRRRMKPDMNQTWTIETGNDCASISTVSNSIVSVYLSISHKMDHDDIWRPWAWHLGFDHTEALWKLCSRCSLCESLCEATWNAHAICRSRELSSEAACYDCFAHCLLSL